MFGTSPYGFIQIQALISNCDVLLFTYEVRMAQFLNRGQNGTDLKTPGAYVSLRSLLSGVCRHDQTFYMHREEKPREIFVFEIIREIHIC